MLINSNVGWIYIKKDNLYFKKKTKKILPLEKIKIKPDNINIQQLISFKNYIEKGIDIKIWEYSVNYLHTRYDIISWAMNIENKEIKLLKKKIEIEYYDIAFMIKYPIIFRIGDAIIKKNENLIEIEYKLKDSFIVYLIINEWVSFYEYDNVLKITIGDIEIEWTEYKIKNIEFIFKKIIQNEKCSIKIENSKFYYEMSIKYNGKEIIKNI